MKIGGKNGRQQLELKSFETLFKLLQKKAYKTAYFITRDPALAEEVVQEALYRAYRWG